MRIYGPLVVHPPAGEPWTAHGEVWHPRRWVQRMWLFRDRSARANGVMVRLPAKREFAVAWVGRKVAAEVRAELSRSLA